VTIAGPLPLATPNLGRSHGIKTQPRAQLLYPRVLDPGADAAQCRRGCLDSVPEKRFALLTALLSISVMPSGVGAP
jgi:hypothetical protein